METGRSSGLTDREREVLIMVVQGSTNREIASRLWLSIRTVEDHVSHVLEKTGTKNRTEAACRGLREGWIEDV